MASDRPSPLPPVVLDANLLYPFQLRNLLVQFGADSVIAPRWTTRIHTMNLRDFPASALSPHGVVAVHPDGFLCGLYDADPELLRASTETAHANLGRSAPSFADYLDTLEPQGLTQLTKRLRGQLA